MKFKYTRDMSWVVVMQFTIRAMSRPLTERYFPTSLESTAFRTAYVGVTIKSSRSAMAEDESAKRGSYLGRICSWHFGNAHFEG